MDYFWSAYKSAIKCVEKLEESRHIFVLHSWLATTARKFKLESFDLARRSTKNSHFIDVITLLQQIKNGV